MGRILTLITLLILGTVAVRTQQPSPFRTNGLANGVAWRTLSPDTKSAYIQGAMGGYTFGALTMQRSKGCAAPLLTWIQNNPHNSLEMVGDIDTFYQDGANASIPVIAAFEYNMMKMGGVTKRELDEYLILARQ